MTSVGKSLREAHRPTRSLATPKSKMRVGCWNVRTMYTVGKAAQVAREMERYRLDLMGLSEITWTGAGRIKMRNGYTMIYAGEKSEHQRGVAIMMSQDTQKSLIEWTAVSSRIITARFYSRFKNTTVIQAYAPTNESTDDEKDDFYEQLQATFDTCNRHDIVIVMGDLNAKVGHDNKDMEGIMGKHGLGNINDNGERLCDFCSMNGLVITGTCFPHRTTHKATWVSPDGRTQNQIDHMMIRKEWRRSVEDTRVYRGADAASDHYLLVMKIKLKLHRNPDRARTNARFDTQKLENEMFKSKFSVELSNRFAVLEVEENINEDCIQMEKVYIETAERVLGRVKKWLREETWEAIDQRQMIHNEIQSTKSERRKSKLRLEYKMKDREVKHRAREDKRVWLEQTGHEAEKYAENGRTRELYQTAKKITNKRRCQVATVKNKRGEIIKDKNARLERWAEHFEEVLVREAPANPIEENEVETDEISEMDTTEIKEAEVKQALRKTKSGRTPGTDGIPAELYKADSDVAVKELTRLFNRIWHEEKVPDQWKKGLIVKIPKRGDLKECKNWRGVTLLPVASKVMGRVIIERIQNGVDHVLRKEQAGFRKNKSTVDQIFILRNIIEQVNEWQATFYAHFVDFEKAFDSVHREGLWRIMKAYGIPDKLITMVKIMYDDFECSVLDEGEQTRWFKITTGVKQGCVMSGVLFLLTVDWTMRRTTENHRNGIRWNFTSTLEDLDFADDIVLISSKYEHVQSKTNRLVDNAGRVGLKLNAQKCKVMRMNSRRED